MTRRTCLLVIIFFVLFLEVKSLDGEVVEEIDDGHSSSGTILRKQQGRTQSSSSGGVIFLARSQRPRASAVRTFHDAYVGGDRTPKVKVIDNERQGFEHDLHTAYRLPLQRLSDRQLNLLLTKYSPETTQENHSQMDRIDMINKVQEKIIERSQSRLIRPTLLTNINTFPEEVTIDSQPAIDSLSHQRTTVGSIVGTTPSSPIAIRKPEIRRSQKRIPELETVEESSSHGHRTAHNLREMKAMLHQVKARYDGAKLAYLRRLRELNERKITLAVPKKVEPKKATKTSTKDVHLVVDSEAQSEVKKYKKTETKQGFSMADSLRQIIARVKTQKKKIKLHDGGNDEEVKAEVPKVIIPPRASPIPKIFAVNTEEMEKEHVSSVPKVIGLNLHSGGENDKEETISSSSASQHYNEQSAQRQFSFNMKKVSTLTTNELINQLHEELKTSVTPIPSTSPATIIEHIEESTTVKTEQEEKPEELIVSSDEYDLDAFATETNEEAICDAISCNFEKGDLCQWEASSDEISPGDPHYRRRYRQAHYVQRTWHNWQGRYRNHVTGIARAQVFSFENQRFAAAYVRPFQRATLTGRLLSGEQETIRFRAWEATRNVQLRLCCDTTENCVFETEIGVFRGNRRWREHTATCPAGTSKVIFECINHGIYQGACGLDNIHLVNLYCPQIIPLVPIIDNGDARRF